uniref:Uncharacterized protein n=1 Tax=Arundo donax TaxID=35708 RepID=A0A0A8ZK84_ARUDO
MVLSVYCLWIKLGSQTGYLLPFVFSSKIGRSGQLKPEPFVRCLHTRWQEGEERKGPPSASTGPAARRARRGAELRTTSERKGGSTAQTATAAAAAGKTQVQEGNRAEEVRCVCGLEGGEGRCHMPAT